MKYIKVQYAGLKMGLQVGLAVSLLGLAGCGGGGGGAAKSPEPTITTYAITTAPGVGGELVVDNAKPQQGNVVVATALPSAGYGLESFSGCGSGTSQATAHNVTYTTAPITASCTISATFKKVAKIEGMVFDDVVNSAPLVTAKCADGTGFSTLVYADDNDKFVGYVGEKSFPCALKATLSPTKAYYGLAQASGTANITLLTDLALTLASGKVGADWFAASDWQTAAQKLPASLTKLEDALFNMGYDLPAGSFQPLTAPLLGNAAWELLQRQVRDGAEGSSFKSYAGLASALKNGDATQLATPSGAVELSAEICFNPVFYADGTTSSYEADYPRLTDQNGIITPAYQLTSEVLSQTTATENGVPVQTLSLRQRNTNASGVTEYNMTEKRTIDLVSKSERVFYTDVKMMGNSFHAVFEMIGNRIMPFNLRKGESYSGEYTEINRYLSDGVTTQYDYTTEVTFKGLTTVVRNNAAQTVCEFSIQTSSSSPGFPMTNIPQNQTIYKRVHDGLDMTTPYMTLFTLNGKDIYKKTP